MAAAGFLGPDLTVSLMIDAYFQCGEFKFPDVTSPLNKILSRPPRNRVCFSNSDAAGTDYAGFGGGGGCATATGGYNVVNNNGLNGLTSSLRPQSGTVNGELSNLYAYVMYVQYCRHFY